MRSQKKYKVTIDISKERIKDLFISACEGGSNYWCHQLTPKGRSGDAYDQMFNGFKVYEIEAHPKKKPIQVTPQMISRAVEMFPNKAPRQFAEWMDQNDDAGTADCFLQLCVFGDIIYG